jgi:hypothetical protein
MLLRPPTTTCTLLHRFYAPVPPRLTKAPAIEREADARKKKAHGEPFFFVSLLCLGLRLIYIEERRERINVE